MDARPRFYSSGVFWRPGVIVTAEHTIRREEEIAVTLADGAKVAARLAGSDPGTDIAVLRVEEPAPRPSPRRRPAHARPPRAEPGALARFRRERHYGNRQRGERGLAHVAGLPPGPTTSGWTSRFIRDLRAAWW